MDTHRQPRSRAGARDGKQPAVRRAARRRTRKTGSRWCSGASSGCFARKEHRSRFFLMICNGWMQQRRLLEHLATHSEVRHLLAGRGHRDNRDRPCAPALRTLGGDPQKPERGSRRSCWRPSSSTMSAGLSAMSPLRAGAYAAIGGAGPAEDQRNPFFAIQFFIGWRRGAAHIRPRRGWRGNGTSIDIRAKSYTITWWI